MKFVPSRPPLKLLVTGGAAFAAFLVGADEEVGFSCYIRRECGEALPR